MGVIKMKKKNFTVNIKMAEGLYKIGYSFSKISANTKCCCIFHQPAMPDCVRKLKRDKKDS